MLSELVRISTRSTMFLMVIETTGNSFFDVMFVEFYYETEGYERHRQDYRLYK